MKDCKGSAANTHACMFDRGAKARTWVAGRQRAKSAKIASLVVSLTFVMTTVATTNVVVGATPPPPVTPSAQSDPKAGRPANVVHDVGYQPALAAEVGASTTAVDLTAVVGRSAAVSVPSGILSVKPVDGDVGTADSPSSTNPATGDKQVPGDHAGATGTATPSSVAPATSTTSAARVRVDLLGDKVAHQIGGDKVAFRLHPLDRNAIDRRVAVVIDYSTFETTYGGDWALRLQLRKLPACALTTPDDPACDRYEIIPTSNSYADNTLTATVPVESDSTAEQQPSSRDGHIRRLASSSGGSVYTLAAGASSSAGDYTASPLAPSSTWSTGLGSGDFNYSYPFPMVPSPHGSTPSFGVTYSSQSVDGMTISSNNQSGVAGLGWTFGTGFIERRYKPCTQLGGATTD